MGKIGTHSILDVRSLETLMLFLSGWSDEKKAAGMLSKIPLNRFAGS
jgi:hypothetical protein